jgi:hypothetical protein
LIQGMNSSLEELEEEKQLVANDEETTIEF